MKTLFGIVFYNEFIQASFQQPPGNHCSYRESSAVYKMRVNFVPMLFFVFPVTKTHKARLAPKTLLNLVCQEEEEMIKQIFLNTVIQHY